MPNTKIKEVKSFRIALFVLRQNPYTARFKSFIFIIADLNYSKYVKT